MGAAVGGMDIVGKGDQQLVVAFVILHGHLGLGGAIGEGALYVDNIRMNDLQGFPFMQELHKAGDAALVKEILLHPVFRIPLVHQLDMDASVQKRLLPQTGFQGFIFVDRAFAENLRIRLEGDLRPCFCGVAYHLQVGDGFSPFKPLAVNMSAVADLYLQPGGEGVDHRGSHAVKAAGNLVAAAAELSAGVKHGKHHRHRRDSHFWLDSHWDAAAVVLYHDDIAGENPHVDFIAVAGQGLVDGVVHDLVDQVMQAPGPGGADIHARTLPDGLQSLQHLYVACAVFFVGLRNLIVFQGETSIYSSMKSCKI